MRHLRPPQRSPPFDGEAYRLIVIFIRRHGREKIAGIGEAIGADRATLGQREGATIILAHVAARGSIGQLDPKRNAARDDDDFTGLGQDDAHLGHEAQPPLLRHDQHLAIGVPEHLVGHRAGSDVDVRRHPRLRAGITRRRDGVHAFNEGVRSPGHRWWPPTQLAQ